VQYQGAALASVGLLFQHLFHKVLIPATFSYADLPPWGSHPLLDPLWSTEVTDFEHDGAEATRVDKAAYISRHETAMRWLRVCWTAYMSHLYDWGWLTSTNRPYNCGRCGKCLTTMVNLRAAGTLERCETLPHTIDPKDIMKIDRARPDDLVMTRQNIKSLERAGGDPELVRALKWSIQPTALYPRRRYQVANVLTGAKPLEVSGVRGLVRQHRGIRLREISDPEEWNTTVKSLGGSIAQSWEWGVFHEPEGWNPMRLVDEEGRAAVQLLVFERRGGFSVAHAPYGPLVGDAADLPGLVDSIALRARECRACLLGFEPKWGPEAGREVLGTDGFANARRSLPGSTIIVDIPQDPEEHLRALPKDTRSGILRARHQGVEVETVTGNSVEKKGVQEFLNLLEGSSMRQGFTLAPASYYWRLLIVLPARLLLARYEGRVVAGALIAAFGDEAYYLYGAFRPRESLLALDLVQWEAMDFARKMGCSRYDMWGMPYRPYPDFWAWGYDPSKERFGGAPIEYVEPSSRILSKPQFWEQRVISLGVEGYQAWRKRHGRASGR
jgi:lipid II:glycine glycyltransferase (peptidoglycan interpeptide bridge formation enzyme)